MRKSTKILTILTIGTSVMIGSAMGVAHAATEKVKSLRNGIFSQLASLDITNEQRDNIHAILRKHQPEIEPLIKQFVTERRVLRDLVLSDISDEAAIRVQTARVAATQTDLAVHVARLSKEVRAELKPEQLNKLAEMKKKLDSHIDEAIERIGKWIAGS